MEFNYFDIIVSIIVLFLGLKGIINGFFKELFGLIGIIGGIFIASRVGDDAGRIISDTVFKFENSAAVSFTGFLVTLGLFWIFMIGVGAVFKKLSSLSGLGVFDKILGFIFSSSKFFLIASVIAYATYNVQAMKTNIDSIMKKSVVFPILVETGSVIMKLDPVKIYDDINKSVEESSKAIQEEVTKTLQNSADTTNEDVKNNLSTNLEQNL